MIRYVEKNFMGEIIGSSSNKQSGKKMNEIDDQSEEYRAWEKSLNQQNPSEDGN